MMLNKQCFFKLYRVEILCNEFLFYHVAILEKYADCNDIFNGFN